MRCLVCSPFANHLVGGSCIFSVETLVAMLAFKRPKCYERSTILLFQVSPVMIFHITFCSKGLIAKLAKKRLFMGVDS